MNNTTGELFKKVLSSLKPPPDMTISQWADEYRYLSPEASAEPGKWHTYKAPYQREIMDAISDINVQKVVIMSAAQIGKTDGFILNTIGYYMQYDPSPMLVLEPTIKLGEAFSKDRLSPMVRDTPVLSNKIDENNKKSGNTILHKIFPGGHITIVGANSPTDLASRPIRILLANEVDKYPLTAGKEGDPLTLASKRLTTFWNKKEVYVSTPTIKDASRIEIEYENSTKEVWTVPCTICFKYTTIEWANIIFDKNNLDDITCVCPNCGAISSEVDWKEQFIKGRYKAEYPERKTRGFHINSLVSNFTTWREIIEKFLQANEEKKKGNIELLRTWVNSELGQTWEDEGEQIDEQDLFRRREVYGCEVPADVLCLTAGVDTQDDRFEIEVVGWGVDKESWGIKYQVIYGDLNQKNIWNDLDEFLLQTFETFDGRKLKILSACIDTGGHFTNEVYKFCKPRFSRRVFAIKGGNRKDAPYISKPTKGNKEQIYLFTLGVDTGKSLLFERLKLTEPGAGYCHFSTEQGKGYNEDYFTGLTSERLVITYKKGRPIFEWRIKDTRHKRNEALDCRNYATAALEIANPVLKPDNNKTPPINNSAKRGVRSKGI